MAERLIQKNQWPAWVAWLVAIPALVLAILAYLKIKKIEDHDNTTKRHVLTVDHDNDIVHSEQVHVDINTNTLVSDSLRLAGEDAVLKMNAVADKAIDADFRTKAGTMDTLMQFKVPIVKANTQVKADVPVGGYQLMDRDTWSAGLQGDKKYFDIDEHQTYLTGRVTSSTNMGTTLWYELEGGLFVRTQQDSLLDQNEKSIVPVMYTEYWVAKAPAFGVVSFCDGDVTDSVGRNDTNESRDIAYRRFVRAANQTLEFWQECLLLEKTVNATTLASSTKRLMRTRLDQGAATHGNILAGQPASIHFRIAFPLQTMNSTFVSVTVSPGSDAIGNWT